MQVKSFTLINLDKIDRALNGTNLGNGSATTGVANGAYLEEGVWKNNGKNLSVTDVSALEDALLAEYDRLGGLIKKGDDKVKTGSFYDFKGKKPRETPEVTYIFRDRINNRLVEVKEGVELPGSIKASKMIDAEEEATRAESSDEEVEEKPVKRGKKK